MKMKRLPLILLVIFGILQSSSGQNLFDSKSTLQFANYLNQSGQPKLAALEFERLIFLEPEIDSLKYSLLDCYILDKNYSAVYRRSVQLTNTSNSALSSPLQGYAAFALISDRKHIEANQFIDYSNKLDAEKKAYYKAWNFILQNKFSEAANVAEPYKTYSAFSGISEIQSDALKLPRKSPWLAGLLSTAVPGAGKWYAKERKDAVIGFISISMMAYQAYRGFKKDGQNSVYGWISAGLGTGFYLGNIYGAVKSAKRFNSRQYAKLQPSIEKHFTIYR
jgi:hypothetical protein